jgi:hypothetical protein
MTCTSLALDGKRCRAPTVLGSTLCMAHRGGHPITTELGPQKSPDRRDWASRLRQRVQALKQARLQGR